MQVKKQQLELDMEQRTSFKLGKEYINAAYSTFNLSLHQGLQLQHQSFQ